MTPLYDKLHKAERGLCTENPDDYLAGLSVSDAIAVRDLIQTLYSALSEYIGAALPPAVYSEAAGRARDAMKEAERQGFRP